MAEKRLALPIGHADPPYPPEALALHPPPKGKCTVGVRWTKAGLGGLDLLARWPAARMCSTARPCGLRTANWRTDIATAAKDEPFTKIITFTPP